MNNQLIKEPYNPNKMDALYQNLVADNKAGNPQDYEIQLDGFTVINKNNDPERFSTYIDFISPETKNITVILYRKNQNSYVKFSFSLVPDTISSQEQLKGIEPKKTIDENELKEKWRKDLYHEELIKENARLKKEIADYDSVIARQGVEIDDIKNNRDLNIQTVGGSIIKMIADTDYIKKNAPIVNELAGTPKKDAKQNEDSSFKRKGQDIQDVESEERNTKGMTEKERRYIMVIDEMRNRIGDVEFANVMHLLNLISSNPQSIAFANKQVTNYLKQNPNPTTDEKV